MRGNLSPPSLSPLSFSLCLLSLPLSLPSPPHSPLCLLSLSPLSPPTLSRVEVTLLSSQDLKIQLLIFSLRRSVCMSFFVSFLAPRSLSPHL